MSRNFKIKNPSEKDLRGSKEKEYVTCSFRYLTTNKNYDIHKHNSFKKNTRKHLDCLLALMIKLKDINETSWEEIGHRPKETGYETINSDQIKFMPNGLNIARDSKIYILRFCSQNYRIIAYKQPKKPVLEIIGFDFDYSAYNHE